MRIKTKQKTQPKLNQTKANQTKPKQTKLNQKQNLKKKKGHETSKICHEFLPSLSGEKNWKEKEIINCRVI